MEVPIGPSQWTLDLVGTLVEQGYLETDNYDFKAQLTSKEPEYNKNLTKTACAFANTRGGFIIFGVSDLGEKKTARIEGIPLSDDLANEFGHRIRGASPTVHFDFGNPPLRLPQSDRVIFVVHVPRSPDRPHMCDGQFYYRTNEGNRQMSYEQVREAFLQYEERRYKMKHLFVELLEIQADARLIMKPRNDEDEIPMLSIDAGVLNSLLVDVYSLVQDDPQLVTNLLLIRRMTSVINNAVLDFRAVMTMRMSDKERKRIAKHHNDELRLKANDILKWTEQCIEWLEKRYALKNPLSSQSKSPGKNPP